MERDPRLANASEAVANLGNECVAEKYSPLAMANEIAIGLTLFMGQHLKPDQAAALLREHAALVNCPDRSAFSPSMGEMLELSDKATQFIRTLELAGVDEATAVTALHNACILRVARTRSAVGAVAWLRRIADATESDARNVDRVAQSI